MNFGPWLSLHLYNGRYRIQLLHGDFKSRSDAKVDFHDKVSVADQQYGSCRIGRCRCTIGPEPPVPQRIDFVKWQIFCVLRCRLGSTTTNPGCCPDLLRSHTTHKIGSVTATCSATRTPHHNTTTNPRCTGSHFVDEVLPSNDKTCHRVPQLAGNRADPEKATTMRCHQLHFSQLLWGGHA